MLEMCHQPTAEGWGNKKDNYAPKDTHRNEEQQSISTDVQIQDL